MNVLCLAARIGTEVKSFLDMGCFAVGIDLEPGTQNKYVVYGDFQNIQFADNTIDLVFTNSLDHVFDFDKIISEIKRVLKPKGILILEIMKGEDEGGVPGYYETVAWKKVGDVLEKFSQSGFEVLKRSTFNNPWDGEHVVLRLIRKTNAL